MAPRLSLILRSLRHYWRTNLAVTAGVAVAVTVLAGALLVGNSVRGSLRDLVLQRIGAADLAVLADDFFREALAGELAGEPAFSDQFAAVIPIAVLQGIATEQASGRAASRVLVYGVDDRFWTF